MAVALLRAGAATVALGCLALAIVLAGHYPIQPAGVVAGTVLWALIVLVWPGLWLFVVPALLPIIGFAPWTGWVTFEELDVLVLGAAAGGYASIAVRSIPLNVEGRRDARMSIFALVLVVLFAASDVLGLYRGLAAAGDYRFGWFHGYGDALNSLRVFKSYALAVLLLPLIVTELWRSPQRSADLLAAGVTVGLGGAALSVLWERLAFADLLDFSSDYRATGLFWEMHVGGAALDGFLALTVPFGVWGLVRASNPRSLVAALALTGLASYACLATFSRGLYVAVPLSLALMVVLLAWGRQGIFARPSLVVTVKGVLAVIAAATGAFIVFRAGGYRSLIAVFAVLAVMLPLRSVTHRLTMRTSVLACIVGVAVGAIGAIAGPLIYKGVYVIFALLFVVCAMAILRHRSGGDERWAPIALSCQVGLIIVAANVAWFWGGWGAFRDASAVLAGVLLLAVWNARAATPLWSDALRAQGAILGSALLLAGVVAVFSGGAYMSGRFSSVEQDFAGRMWHWGDSLGMMKSESEWLLGRGAGRFPADYVTHVPATEVPGAYRLTTRDGQTFLSIFGAGKPGGSGQLFRVSQRVPIAPGEKYVVVLEVRAKRDTTLIVEICEKNLLYSQTCAARGVAVRPSAETWQRMIVPLDGQGLARGRWYAPHLAFFSLAVDSPGAALDIGQVSVVRSDGRNLVTNGDWSVGLAHWFFTSDREHLPWHIKNLALHLLFDQGAVGVLLFALLVGTALWRVTIGDVRHHPIAPTLAASLVGFLVVGLFDSLLDVPRVAFLFYLLMLTSLVLCQRKPPDSDNSGLINRRADGNAGNASRKPTRDPA